MDTEDEFLLEEDISEAGCVYITTTWTEEGSSPFAHPIKKGK